jgi:hypothetical protein
LSPPNDTLYALDLLTKAEIRHVDSTVLDEMVQGIGRLLERIHACRGKDYDLIVALLEAFAANLRTSSADVVVWLAK